MSYEQFYFVMSKDVLLGKPRGLQLAADNKRKETNFIPDIFFLMRKVHSFSILHELVNDEKPTKIKVGQLVWDI